MDSTHAQFLSVGHVPPDARWRMKAHSHSFHEMIFVVRGRLHVEAGAGRQECGVGDVLLYPAQLVHTEWAEPSDPVESFFIGFKDASLRHGTVLSTEDHNGRMRQMARWLYDDRDAAHHLVTAEREALLHALLAEFHRHPRGEGDERVACARQYVREHIGQVISLGALAGAVRLSKFYFLRTYKAHTGRTPMEDVRALRADYARDLILGTALPLKEIARRAGLGNEYSLSRVFRRHFDMTPGQFRRFERGGGRGAGR